MSLNLIIFTNPLTIVIEETTINTFGNISANKSKNL